MSIPADITNVRAAYKREQDTVFALHRLRAGVPEPAAQGAGGAGGESTDDD
jgi:hypothetical protein